MIDAWKMQCDRYFSLFMLVFIYIPSKQLPVQYSDTNSWKRCEIFSKLAMKTPERRQWSLSSVAIINFAHISYLSFSVSIADFQHVNVCWVALFDISDKTPWTKSFFNFIIIIYFLLVELWIIIGVGRTPVNIWNEELFNNRLLTILSRYLPAQS